MSQQKVGIIMGSDSDFPVMEKALAILDEQGVAYEVRIISAHRTPEEMLHYAKEAKARGYAIIIAGAGGAAHLPGMVASMCSLPVIGVPVKSRSMEGIDSILSILQMPAGIPVATVGLNNAEGAAKLAVRMLRCHESLGSAKEHTEENARENVGDVLPKVKILFDESDASREDLEKVTETLHFYGLEHEVIDLSNDKDTRQSVGNNIEKMLRITRKGDTALLSEGTMTEEGVFAVLNLVNFTSSEIEEINQVTTLPVIFVPTKENTPSQSDVYKNSMQTVEDICKRSITFNADASSVAMLAVNGYQNAGIMLARIVGIHDVEVYNRVAYQQGRLREMVVEKDKDISAKFSCKIGNHERWKSHQK
jgi:phosphoribosylaminoimidazole carboxylase, PurE protein